MRPGAVRRPFAEKEFDEVDETRARVGGNGEDGTSALSGLSEISREMVRIYKEQFGRGPTRARTDFAGPNLVVCTVEESLTSVERRMVEMGEHQRLRDLRLYFQHATETNFCEMIERVVGRRVRAFVSGMDTGEDVAAELFYLEPGPSDEV